MENVTFFLLFIISFAAIFWYVIKKRRDNADVNNNLSRQEEYYSRKVTNIPKLSAKEKLSLSWEPIKNLAEYIISKFSDIDKVKLAELGGKLLKNGMKYIHVVDYAIPKKDYTRNIESEKEQNVDKNNISR